MKRVAIAAGGTGGHFYPGLVVAKELKARGWEPLVIVRSADPALEILEKEGLAALPVDLHGLPRRLSPALLTFARGLVSGIGTLSRALRAFKPDLALGMGGYLTFPLVYAAWRRGIPRAVHESNTVLGLANAASLKLGAELFWGLPPAASSARGTVVGTPVRPTVWKRRGRSESRRALGLPIDRTILLVFGGSQGAQSLNAALPRALKSLANVNVQILHLAGKGKSEATLRAYKAAGVTADVRDYLEDMSSAYGAADLVVCRAGASTLAELAAQRAPALLVPYPHATAGHQDANARVFERAGAAMRLEEKDLDAKLGGLLTDLLKSDGVENRRLAMASAYSRLELPPAEKTAVILAGALERLCLPPPR